MEECVFSKVNACGKLGKPLSDSTPQRIASIIHASQVRDDGLHVYVEEELSADPNCSVKYHRDCVSTYVSKHHLDRLPKRASSSGSPYVEAKRHRRSEIPPFDFLCHCIFCGEICDLERVGSGCKTSRAAAWLSRQMLSVDNITQAVWTV